MTQDHKLQTLREAIENALRATVPGQDGETRRFLMKAHEAVVAALLRGGQWKRARACPRCQASGSQVDPTSTWEIMYCPICRGFFSTDVVPLETATRYCKLGSIHQGQRPSRLLFYDFLIPNREHPGGVEHLTGYVASNGRKEVLDMLPCPRCGRVWDIQDWEAHNECECGQPTAPVSA